MPREYKKDSIRVAFGDYPELRVESNLHKLEVFCDRYYETIYCHDSNSLSEEVLIVHLAKINKFFSDSSKNISISEFLQKCRPDTKIHQLPKNKIS